MATPAIPADIAAMTFEEAMDELEKIVDRLEGGDVPLDQSVAEYERGALLRRHCTERLEAARLRVDQITQTPDGTIATGPLTGGDGS